MRSSLFYPGATSILRTTSLAGIRAPAREALMRTRGAGPPLQGAMRWDPAACHARDAVTVNNLYVVLSNRGNLQSSSHTLGVLSPPQKNNAQKIRPLVPTAFLTIQ